MVKRVGGQHRLGAARDAPSTLGNVVEEKQVVKKHRAGRSTEQPRDSGQPPDVFAGLPKQVFPAANEAEKALAAFEAANPEELQRPSGPRGSSRTEPWRDTGALPQPTEKVTATREIQLTGRDQRTSGDNASHSLLREDADVADGAVSAKATNPGARLRETASDAVLRRIYAARKWQDLQSLVGKPPRGFDAVAVAATLDRLSQLMPDGIARLETAPGAAAQETASPAMTAVDLLCTELMSLLQLQLPRLPGSYLSLALGAVGKLGARPPKPTTWVPLALAACQSKMTR